MRHTLQHGFIFRFPSLRRTTTLLVFANVVFLPAGILHAQDAVSTSGQGATGTGMDSQRGNAVSSPTAGFNGVPPDFGQTGSPPQSSISGPTAWNHLLLDAFQLGMRFGNRSGAPGSTMGFNGSGQGAGGGTASQFVGGPSRSAAGGNSFDLNSTFGMAGNLSRDLGAGKSGTLGTALGVLPAFDQLTRTGLNLPLNSSFGNFKLSYRDFLGGVSGPAGGKTGYGSPSASFTNSLRTRRVDFSAAASVNAGSMGEGLGTSSGMSSFGGQTGGSSSFGSQQMGGAMGSQSSSGPGGGQGGRPGGPVGSSNGGGKGPGASLSLHLSF